MTGTGYKHSDSDRKLDKEAQAVDTQAARDTGSSSGAGHDPAEISKHDDTGKDRLFEGREQHDDAEQASEKNRLSKDVDRHNHPKDDDDAGSGSGTGSGQKQ